MTQPTEKFLTYPKIETLWPRDPDTYKVLLDRGPRLKEFGLVQRWTITEKVDGTNIRICLDHDGSVYFGGRTARAVLPSALVSRLLVQFPQEKMQSVFHTDEDGIYPYVVLFGEGYGPKIQGGGGYADAPSFILFDVWINGWWQDQDSLEAFARELGVMMVPVLNYRLEGLPGREKLYDMLPCSEVAYVNTGVMDVPAEGIVARTDPLLFDRRGNRVMWKLKFKDFPR